MKPNLYRQLRFIVLIVAGIGIIAITGALLVVYWNERLQREFLDALVVDEYHEFLEHIRDHPDAPLPRAAQLRIWMDGHPTSDPLPKSLRRLPPGTHHDVPLQGDIFHVLKTETDGYPTYVAIKISVFSYQERWLQRALIGIALLEIPLALLMGIWLVRRVASPLERLAQRVSELDPVAKPIHIGEDFRGLEVEQIAHAIDQYQDRLRGFINRERTFTAAASHELRTPLTTIRTSAEVLNYDPRLDPALAHYTRNLIKTSVQMSETLEGLMWFSREHQEPRTEPVNLHDRIRDIADDFTQRKIEFTDLSHNDEESRQTYTLPSSLLNIVITNLLRNACQFSPEDSVIHIELQGQQICIRNEGPGIPAEDLPRVFQRHFRSSSSQGQGLGLYIASNICERMNWQLNIVSNEDHTTVMISLDQGT